MIFELLCVVADETEPAGTIPPSQPTRQTIVQPRGEASTYRLRFIHADGQAYDLSTALGIRMAVRRQLADASAMFTREATIDGGSGGTAGVVLAEDDTIGLIDKKDYLYDIQLTDADGDRWQAVPVSSFHIAPIVGQPSEPILPPLVDEGAPIAIGPPGAAGLSILNGIGPPDDADGRDGEWYVDRTDPEALVMYGPKAAGTWGAGYPFGGGGADLSAQDPLPLGVADPGAGPEAAAWDHVHAHGDQGGGSLHADVVAGGAAGFMSGAMATQLADLVAADFDGQIADVAADVLALTTTVGGHTTQISDLTADLSALDGIVGGHTTTLASHTSSIGTLTSGLSAANSDIAALQGIDLIAGAGLAGGGDLSGPDRTFAVGQNADASITVNANDIQLSTVLQAAISTNTSDIASLAGTVSGLSSVYVPQTRTVTAGAGLAGGGDLSANRTLAVGANADGSIAVNADDIQVGVLATDAQHGSRGGGTQHADVVAGGASGFMTGTQATQLATNTTALGVIAATWPVTTAGVQQVRCYLIDYDGGNDSNVGYIDGAAGATLVPAGLAIKTWERFFQIFPKLGNGRWAVVLWKARAAAATYLKQDGVTADSILTGGISGYAYLRVSGSTDLTNSASDQITQGCVQVETGPNGDGSFTVGAASTTTLLNLNAGSISAEPASTQYRIRFSPTTVTVALRNQCRLVTANTTGSLTLGSAASTTPATGGAGDQFFIERPGCVVDKIDWAHGVPQSTTFGLFFNYLTGVRTASTTSSAFKVSAASTGLSFVECSGATNTAVFVASDTFNFSVRDTFNTEAAAAITLGMGLRLNCQGNVNRVYAQNITCLGAMRAATSFSWAFCTYTNGGVGPRSYFANAPTFNLCGTPGGANLGETSGFILGDTSATNAAPRVVSGQIAVNQSSVGIRRVDVTNNTNGAIKLTGMGCTLVVDGCTGTSGNTDVGIDMSAAVGCTLIAGRSSANTISGTAGDIRLAGTAITTHAALTLVGHDDNAGNKYLGTGTAIVTGCRLLSNQSGGAVAVGDALRGNGTTGQVTSSQGITDATVASIVGVAVTPAASATNVYVAPPGGFPYVLFDGTPTANAIAYLSPGTIRKFTTTIPATGNQRLRCGRVVSLSGSTGQIAFSPETLAEAAATGVP